MRLHIRHKIVEYNAGQNDTHIDNYDCKYTTNTKLSDVVRHHNCGKMNISSYYTLALRRGFYDDRTAYIINDSGEIVWNIEAENTLISDILRTHNLSEELEVMTFIAEIGGAENLKDVVELWDAVQPTIIQISKALGSLFVIEKAIKRVARFFKKKDVSPFSFFDLIYSRDSWNHYELAKMVGCDPQDMKSILKVSGYVWNNSTKQYEAKNTEALQDKLRSIDLVSSKPFKG